ncbi:hypothetical protein BDB00DRAFT_329278 [Zychaea mexicana]|uniref:uncharacterized protein n=1 Tax=Zychaea mexicana TaxID=64656 RepID=UPI0022FE8761|nr:uncharacterized protein BDB00DRAFT_329278 [Zychaea mexicana]KAI9498987.1 hypothetical protein BDB00DRAFT_329278 [Zychaea mexicana]
MACNNIKNQIISLVDEDAIDERLFVDDYQHISPSRSRSISTRCQHQNNINPKPRRCTSFTTTTTTKKTTATTAITETAYKNDDVRPGPDSVNQKTLSSAISSLPTILITDYDIESSSMSEIITSEDYLPSRRYYYCHKKNITVASTDTTTPFSPSLLLALPPTSLSNYHAGLIERYRHDLSALLQNSTNNSSNNS